MFGSLAFLTRSLAPLWLPCLWSDPWLPPSVEQIAPAGHCFVLHPQLARRTRTTTTQCSTAGAEGRGHTHAPPPHAAMRSTDPLPC